MTEQLKKDVLQMTEQLERMLLMKSILLQQISA